MQKFVIIAGAGCTLSDAAGKPKKNQPPLDKGFFYNAARLKHSEFTTVRQYLENTYDFNPTNQERDSLESVMAMLYADIHNPKLEGEAVPAFGALIKLLSRRIAETTNPLNPTNRSNLYRVICRALDAGVQPKEICVITFNQDLQVEKTLEKIQSTGRAAKFGPVFSFPYCYEISGAVDQITRPRKDVKIFITGNINTPTVRILKLHGSLNWFSIHQSPKAIKKAILNPSRPYRITPRSQIALDLKFRAKGSLKRQQYTFPLIIPPVTHKAGILHKDILPLWEKAAMALKSATKIVVFGYSCPDMDFESANLIRRTIGKNDKLEEFSIIDPNPQVFQRYADLTGLDKIHYFRTTRSYLK